MNTVLSLLAVDYPAHKLACYLSDDGGSPLTFYSLVEASKFAKLWVPFCKKYNVLVRAPFRYFSSEPHLDSTTSNFIQEWRQMKQEYEQLSRKIEDAAQKPVPCDLKGELAAFSSIERNNHPSIIQVIWENKEGDSNGMPHLVYVSREKRPKHPHHFKGGAMNVLTRVSGVMTNAPFMLNVDCDMYANNPQIILHAMCLLLGSKNERETGFVQSPQVFYDGLKDDPFGNQMVVLQKYLLYGVAGIQGPYYGGTGCFHRRKIIYGLWPNDVENKGKSRSLNGECDHENLNRRFGNSKELAESASRILSGLNEEADCTHDLSSSLEAAHRVASCAYERGTNWGKKVGWVYGSTTEDVLTGLWIHGRGWGSAICDPDPPAFLGCAPSGGPEALTQMKRWGTGLSEILFSRNNPIILTLSANLRLRMSLAYIWILLWGLRSIPEMCYTALSAYCILTNSHFMPKIHEPAVVVPIALFLVYNLYTLSEYLQTGVSIRTWWNNQRMSRIVSATAFLFSALSVLLKLIGLSETVFEVTQKDETSPTGDTTIDAGRFTFDESPIFIPGTTVLLVHLAALAMNLLGFWPLADEARFGIGELVCSMWVVFCFLPFLKGLFGKGKYGIPTSTICKSAALAFLFVHLCI